jgi:hypothetical protein
MIKNKIINIFITIIQDNTTMLFDNETKKKYIQLIEKSKID